MSLPKKLYDTYRELCNTELVKSRNATPENMLEFQTVLNQSTPVEPTEVTQHEFLRCIYFSNPVGFVDYISDRYNRVSAAILWTESKRIAKFFKLSGVVHISWSDDTKSYTVVPYVPRENRPVTTNQSRETTTRKQYSARGTHYTRSNTKGSANNKSHQSNYPKKVSNPTYADVTKPENSTRPSTVEKTPDTEQVTV